MLLNTAILVLSFSVMWFGSGLSILAVDRLSKKLKLSSFLVSFFILGGLTSLSELSIGVFSVINNTPEFSIGNLIGASAVLLLFIIPLFAIISNGIEIKKSKEAINLTLSIALVSLPIFLLLDRSFSIFDGMIIVFAFIALMFTVKNKRTIFEVIEDKVIHDKMNIFIEIAKILFGAGLIIGASHFLINSLGEITSAFNIAPFFVGLLILSFGTNVPEMTILFKSILLKKESIGFGDYVGSAVMNTLVVSVVSFLHSAVNGSDVINISKGLGYNILLLPLGALLFILFTRKERLERKHGIVMLLLYVLFIISEIIIY